MKLLIMQFSLDSCYFLHLGFNIIEVTDGQNDHNIQTYLGDTVSNDERIY
jgi:hypothetical protein